MTKLGLEKILGRNERALDNKEDLKFLKNRKVLVTGALGSLGIELTEILRNNQTTVFATDKSEMDVTKIDSVKEVFNSTKPELVVHLAADKHAPEGELHPWNTLEINTIGTKNIIEVAHIYKSKIVIASTCKACDPETAYGASKLIAERMVLNAGGVVSRFYNVVETSGNVFEIWANLDNDKDIQVTDCFRYFISLNEAISLLIRCLRISYNESGRFILNPGISQYMPDIAQRLFPKRNLVHIPARRGDRRIEPLKSSSERLIARSEELIQVLSPHDPFTSNF